jgi:hypothetical protein
MRGPLENLSVEDFCGTGHREVFRAMLERSEEGCSFDTATIAEALGERGMLEQVGNYPGLAALIDGAVRDPSLIDQHVSTIVSHSRLRRVLSLGESLDGWLKSGIATNEALDHWSRKVRLLQSGRDLDGRLLRSSERWALSAITAEELLAADIKPREMLLDPILPEQGLVMLYGYRGTGKTYIALGIAAAVARGGSFLAWKAVRPRTVLYVDGELPGKTMQERLRLTVRAILGLARQVNSRLSRQTSNIQQCRTSLPGLDSNNSRTC